MKIGIMNAGSLNHQITQKRVAQLIRLHEEHSAAAVAREPERLTVRMKTTSDDPATLAEYFLKNNNEVLFEFSDEQDECFSRLRVPYYHDDMVIGMRMGTAVTVKDNRSVLMGCSGKSFGLHDAFSTRFFPENMPPIYFFGVERSPREMKKLLEKSRELYTFQRQKRKTAKKEFRLKTEAFRLGYTDKLVHYLPLGYSERSLDPAGPGLSDPVLHVTSRIILPYKGYTLVPFEEETKHCLLRVMTESA